MRSSHSPTIRSRYDYYYSSMSPGSTAANYYDNQNQSLFGDPVPPATDFLETLDNHLYGSLRRSSALYSNSHGIGGFAEITFPQPLGAVMAGDSRRTSRADNYPLPHPVLPDNYREPGYYYELNRRPSTTFSDNNADRSDSEILIPTAPNRLFSNEPVNYRNLSMQSSESQHSDSNGSSSEWTKPIIMDNWRNDVQRPKTANKHISHITHIGDAMTAILADSTTSSSEEKSPSIHRNGSTNISQVLPVLPRRNARPTTAAVNRTILLAPTRIMTAPNRLTPQVIQTMHDDDVDDTIERPPRDLSPVILRDTITTGSANRYSAPRQHKKTSFAIINELSPNQSRPPSPSGGRLSPFRGKGFRDDLNRKPRPVSCPESPRNLLKLPKITAHDDNFLHKPTVHFNIEPYIRKSNAKKKRPPSSASKKDTKDSSADKSYQDREIETFEFSPHTRSCNSSRRSSMKNLHLPEIPGVRRPFPAPRRQTNKSTGDLTNETHYLQRRPLVNPRSTQKGLIRIVSSAESSPSKIPRRTSVTRSMDRLPTRRKSISRSFRQKSTSPERQRSVDSSTLIDLGVTASSMTRSANRISKPSALSPIAGTPNKDREDGSRIPVRRNSSLNVRNSSRSNSRTTSRETSPNKPPGTNKSPTKIPRKLGQGSLKKVSSIVKLSASKKSTSTKEGDGNKAPSSAANVTKKEPASARKDSSSSIKKTPSAAVKRETSTLKRQTSTLKRETSNLKPTTLKRENSNLLKRQTSTIKREPSNLSKNQSDSSLAKRLEKKSSFKNKRRTSSESDGLNERTKTTANESSDMLISLTSPNVVSMTAAAIASQPVQITTAVTNQLNKSSSSGQIIASSNDVAIDESRRELTTPADIIENATKTLETIQKTVTDATDEIHKTIEENLTDLKSLEKDMLSSGVAASTVIANAVTEATDSTTAPLQKKASTKTLGGKSDIVKNDASIMMDDGNASDAKMEINSPIETTVNVIDSAGDMTTLRGHNSDERISEKAISMAPDVELDGPNMQRIDESSQNSNGGLMHVEAVGGAKDQRSEADDADPDERITCCKLCKCCTPCYASAICLPCRRLRNLCKRSKKMEVNANNNIKNNVSERIESELDATKRSCWNCCRRTEKKIVEDVERKAKATAQNAMANVNKQHGKCGLCLRRVFCCQKTQKIQSHSNSDDSVGGCCSCWPCRKKPKSSMAWAEARAVALTGEAVNTGVCAKFWSKFLCCRKKPEPESRRTSMNSKKQSIAPTIPPEDPRPRLDEILIERSSLMKAALPVLPITLAWFCFITNCLLPGTGTIFSGLFCLCIGIPRFSAHDSIRARIGSFVINIIVGVAQAFTLIFCLVGWGWSIWWGMILLRTAKQQRRIKAAEHEEFNEQTTIGSNTGSIPIRDVEAGRR